ncbi:MAG: tRNA preQ1(34) S-adenosylmethionine ribosyltransferase-isomerase QueA [Candidatus Omnitrophica bacterium]|nr:tRNA preQ1(34) S-adenosylmethionine ribosyltransferase-isomerase QueA [Candidatus Omnitrophota bacterium]
MRLEDYDFDLPEDRIAQRPSVRRGASRLLVVDRNAGTWEDHAFDEVCDFVRTGEAVVMNDSRVIPARIPCRKETGGKAEVLLVRPSGDSDGSWWALARPRLKDGQTVHAGGQGSAIRCLLTDPDGFAKVVSPDGDLSAICREYGAVPLPPYIRRTELPEDRDRYQTIYAANDGSVAAPTAGLHFEDQHLKGMAARGAMVHKVTLHVGPGTFLPVRDPSSHRMHPESFSVLPKVADALNVALREKRRIWAVGTTTVRTLETCVAGGKVLSGSGETDLFITPPFEFEVVGGLLTNFHLPRSTLLMLVSAFAGRELILEAYRYAVKRKYRFYSYGDAMLIL